MTIEQQRGALSQNDAAAWLGVSVNHFKTHVRPELRPAYIGGVVRFPLTELLRYLDQAAGER